MAKVVMDSELPSIRKAFDFAWMTLTNQFGIFIALMLTFLAVWVILEVIVVAGQRFGVYLWSAAHLGFFAIFASLEIGFIRICLASYDGKEIHFRDVFRELRLGINFFFVQLVYLAITVAGLVCLVLPGAYLGAKYAFYAFHFAEGDRTLKQSFQLSEGQCAARRSRKKFIAKEENEHAFS